MTCNYTHLVEKEFDPYKVPFLDQTFIQLKLGQCLAIDNRKPLSRFGDVT